MFERISNGWALAKQSYRVLLLDKELLVFPLLSGVCCLLVLGSFALPLYFTGQLEAVTEGAGAATENLETTSEDPLAYLVLFAFYFVNYFVITFFNSAMVACAVIRFRGGNPTLADGFGAAFSRAPQILAWALVAATVGTALKMIEDRSQRVGRWVAGLLGMAWTVTTYFVVPVLVVEKVGPVDAIKRSLAILREAWGEAIVANFGLGLIGFLLFLAALIPTVVGIVVGQAGLIIGIAVTVLLLILLAVASSAAKVILLAALYEYASQGQAPPQFDQDMLRGAFVVR